MTGVFQITAAAAWETAAGVIGLVLIAVAVYAALAIALQDARHEPLPTGAHDG